MTVAVVRKFYSGRVGLGGREGEGNFIDGELGSVGKVCVGNNFYRRGTRGSFEQRCKI